MLVAAEADSNQWDDSCFMLYPKGLQRYSFPILAAPRQFINHPNCAQRCLEVALSGMERTRVRPDVPTQCFRSIDGAVGQWICNRPKGTKLWWGVGAILRFTIRPGAADAEELIGPIRYLEKGSIMVFIMFLYVFYYSSTNHKHKWHSDLLFWRSLIGPTAHSVGCVWTLAGTKHSRATRGGASWFLWDVPNWWLLFFTYAWTVVWVAIRVFTELARLLRCPPFQSKFRHWASGHPCSGCLIERSVKQSLLGRHQECSHHGMRVEGASSV